MDQDISYKNPKIGGWSSWSTEKILVKWTSFTNSRKNQACLKTTINLPFIEGACDTCFLKPCWVWRFCFSLLTFTWPIPSMNGICTYIYSIYFLTFTICKEIYQSRGYYGWWTHVLGALEDVLLNTNDAIYIYIYNIRLPVLYRLIRYFIDIFCCCIIIMFFFLWDGWAEPMKFGNHETLTNEEKKTPGKKNAWLAGKPTIWRCISLGNCPFPCLFSRGGGN